MLQYGYLYSVSVPCLWAESIVTGTVCMPRGDFPIYPGGTAEQHDQTITGAKRMGCELVGHAYCRVICSVMCASQGPCVHFNVALLVIAAPMSIIARFSRRRRGTFLCILPFVSPGRPGRSFHPGTRGFRYSLCRRAPGPAKRKLTFS